ncbi:type IV secretion system protein [Mesorhizobium sp. 113-3-3]|uniref:type IV secretion system protein n=1 Tax=Mesorhizobium sp. 113-3-3 TaxID=2744516 RepID=UPI00192815DB|nr:type IV secretion system protein [Mesorhizobium sp. 113-3-3]
MANAVQKITLSPSRDIPFNKLVLAQTNVRRIKAGVSIEELAASIARRGLIQSIHVRPVLDAGGEETGMFEIPAGGRRYRALEMLVKQKRFAKTASVPCVVGDPSGPILAEEISLAENVEHAPTLAGFVLIPFGLFGKTAFMAERVLGNVISSGIKVLVLAVVIGIGSTLFGQFTQGFGGENPTIDQAMAIVLAALSLLGLGIFGPGIANGLVAGGPQLGAGAAVGTGLAAGGMAVAGYGAAGLAARGGTAAFSGTLSAARGATSLAGGASAAYGRGAAGQAGAAGIASGLGGIARAGASAAVSPLKRAAANTGQSLKSSFAAGAGSTTEITGDSSTMGTTGGAASSAVAPASGVGKPSSTQAQPEWARRLQRSQRLANGAQTAAHAVGAGDSHGGGASISLSEGERPK